MPLSSNEVPTEGPLAGGVFVAIENFTEPTRMYIMRDRTGALIGEMRVVTRIASAELEQMLNSVVDDAPAASPSESDAPATPPALPEVTAAVFPTLRMA